jgi:hypothetical protein
MKTAKTRVATALGRRRPDLPLCGALEIMVTLFQRSDRRTDVNRECGRYRLEWISHLIPASPGINIASPDLVSEGDVRLHAPAD